MNVSAEYALIRARDMFRGATFDSMCVHGDQIDLGFLNDTAIEGGLVAVGLIFGCDAVVYDFTSSKNNARGAIDNDPLASRMEFVSRAYCLIGNAVADVSIGAGGKLNLLVKPFGTITLRPQQSDVAHGDWVWKASIDRTNDAPRNLYCAFEDDQAIFVCDSDIE